MCHVSCVMYIFFSSSKWWASRCRVCYQRGPVLTNTAIDFVIWHSATKRNFKYLDSMVIRRPVRVSRTNCDTKKHLHTGDTPFLDWCGHKHIYQKKIFFRGWGGHTDRWLDIKKNHAKGLRFCRKLWSYNDITESYIEFLGMNFDQFMAIYNNLLQCTAIETGGNLARSWEETKLTKTKKCSLMW